MKKLFIFLFFVKLFACHPCVCFEHASHSSAISYAAAQKIRLDEINLQLKQTEQLLKVLLQEKQAVLREYKSLFAMETDNAEKLKQISNNLEKQNALLYLKIKVYNDFLKENILLNKNFFAFFLEK